MRCGDGIIDRSTVCNGNEVSTGATTTTVCQIDDPTRDQQCDDSNRGATDGCDPSCKVQDRFKCVNDMNAAAPQSVCSPTCGDGLIDTTVNCNQI